MNQIKIFSYWGLLLLTSLYLSAQSENVIQAKEVYKYVSESKIICGNCIHEIFKKSFWGPIFLNFGRNYPNQQMTGLIWFDKSSEYFSYQPEKFLKRKNVCVKGYISEYKGRT